MNFKPFNENGTKKALFTDSNLGFHGDVIIERIENIKVEGLEEDKDKILALGEHTLHCHKLFGDCTVYNTSDERKKLFIVRSETVLKHQEHSPVILPPGNYRTRIQREYDPFTKRIREVTD